MTTAADQETQSVSQNTAISDRPKAKPVSKKEGKNLRKQQVAYQAALQQQQNQAAHLKHLAQINEQLQAQVSPVRPYMTIFHLFNYAKQN